MPRHLRNTLFTVLWGVSCAVAASGLQVSPVSLTLPPTQAADGLWLSNTGDNVVNAQVRVFRWTQVEVKTNSPPRVDCWSAHRCCSCPLMAAS